MTVYSSSHSAGSWACPEPAEWADTLRGSNDANEVKTSKAIVIFFVFVFVLPPISCDFE
jgi:hypothetical protein